MGIAKLITVESRSSGGDRLAVTVAVLLGLVAAGVVPVQTVAGINVSAGLCAAVVSPLGYPCNEYTVQTADGFLLGVQNIPNGVNQLPNGAPRAPVFLQHGLFGGGDNWVFNQPSESLGFILADAGYDVWIGNIRGNMWSHGHVSLTINDVAFWNWSWDEMAAYDLPAMLGLVYEQTGSKIAYIGHSQGTTMLMAALVDSDPSLADILAGVVLACPIAYMSNITSSFDKIAAEIYLDKIFYAFGLQEFNLYNQLGIQLIQDVCGFPNVNCTDVYRAIAGADCCLNDTRILFYGNFYPQGTSSKNMGHYAQMIRHGAFRKYDYGIFGNLQHYMQLTPPAYNLANFPASLPIMIVQGGQDSLADPTNVEYLVDLLGPKVLKRFAIERYAHGDFVVSYSANVDVYPEVMSFIRNPMA